MKLLIIVQILLNTNVKFVIVDFILMKHKIFVIKVKLKIVNNMKMIQINVKFVKTNIIYNLMYVLNMIIF